MRTNNSLHNAMSSKKDEFYTQYDDITKELQHYKEHFRDKVVYCNCDHPAQSEFYKYFRNNFGELKLKKLIATYYSVDTAVYKATYDGKEELTLLKGNGDFKSDECVEILKQSDIVVTNPPFSLFREYVAQLMQYQKKFIIIGNINAITYKEFFPLIKDNLVWVGYKFNGKPMEFIVPDDYPLKGSVCGYTQDGRKYVGVGGTCWFTNCDIPKRHEKLKLTKEYSEEEYPKYDNYDAINVNKTVDIPYDYEGVMGVPILFLGKFNPEQFEIVKFRKGDDEKDLVYTLNGKKVQPYFRILIEHKNKP